MNVRVRYAPSPTGYQHIGGIRTALFDYLLSRSLGGTFILRSEDTDRERFKEDALQDIYDTFDWLGFSWDEGPDKGGDFGPYFQSERREIYRKYTEKLVESGHAYRCYCSSERLEKLREEQQAKKLPQGYDRRCRNLSSDEINSFENRGILPVIRFKIPLEGSTSFHDELLGDIEEDNIEVNPDPVLMKSDGFPTYHLANVVDDHLMEITHILRGQEWLPSVPLHVLLYEAFGWKPPLYYHLPMVLGEDGRKLSKRHGSTRAADFRKEGYLPDALLNYIALLGWSYDDSREFFTLDELVSCFKLNKINKAPAVFDYKKLAWFNGMYIRKKSDSEILDLILTYFTDQGLISIPITVEEKKLAEGVVPLVKERIKLLSEAPQMARFIFKGPENFSAEELIPKKLDASKTLDVLKALKPLIEKFEERSDEENEAIFRKIAAEMEVKLGDLLMPLRIALTGSKVSPPLFESIRLLGVKRVSENINKAMEKMESREKG